MQPTKLQLWQRFKSSYSEFPSIRLGLDLSRMDFDSDYFERMSGALAKAFAEMSELEKGAIANADEKRMVGHYWLRDSALAPTETIKSEIDETLDRIRDFATDVHSGKIAGSSGQFTDVLVIGIGGSALGPQFVSRALGHPASDKMRIHFFDNTDPDGMDTVLAGLDGNLGSTLTIVISKSGGTKETRNGMLEAQAAYVRADLKFSNHAVAITGEGSDLDKVALDAGWIARFPMWDWVGGRTSELSAVGVLPAALQGFDIESFISGARAADQLTRIADLKSNPAAQLALAWFHACEGTGAKDMVILPYKDRLELFSKYLQQLIMESLGKELNRSGEIVNQGISVYGNKGSTDQHAYVQQLREGILNFFATFVEVLKDRSGAESIEVNPETTTGDYLTGFLLGTRTALYEKGRQSITLTIEQIDASAVGTLIALYERAVGLYASLININAYHQPGVEAGKKAAGSVLALQSRIISALKAGAATPVSSDEIALMAGAEEDVETVFQICRHLAANNRFGMKRVQPELGVNSKFVLE